MIILVVHDQIILCSFLEIAGEFLAAELAGYLPLGEHCVCGSIQGLLDFCTITNGGTSINRNDGILRALRTIIGSQVLDLSLMIRAF